ncbi:nucleotide exchange factor GrpE, partial [Ruminococcus sp.]|uniref:nucleotide exchange factor GrpE n=1 Tax=Ruminococcus sp. TaxID=41978 RepID=UPI002E7A37AD
MSKKNKAEIPEEEIKAEEETVEAAEAEAVDAEDVPDERDEKIRKLEDDLAAQKDRYMRLAAEYDNYRKRTANEKLGIYDDATSKAVIEILPVADSVRMALENLKDSDPEIIKGVELIKSQLDRSFEKLKIE